MQMISMVVPERYVNFDPQSKPSKENLSGGCRYEI